MVTGVKIGAVNIALATACHLLLPTRWAVTGMAGAYTLSYLAGLALTARLPARKAGGRLDDGTLRATYAKLLAASACAAGAGWAAARACGAAMGDGIAPTVLATLTGTLVLAVVYLLLGRLLKVGELRRLPGLG
ncbi:hypothetical protein [Streptomyces sp. NPDC051636]|uniref:hypothetical protein n=1 Tax=Streptomyces sp. NPDC051636 TaxID=3365663 RepID=UPI0037BB31A3